MTETTAIPVSPVSEGDMNYVRQVFEKMANAIVSSTELVSNVQALSDKCTSLEQRFEDLRTKNIELDDILTSVRKARDEALAEVSRLQIERQDYANIVDVSNSLRQQLAALTSDLVNTRHDRDEAILEAEIAKEELTKVSAKLTKFKELLSNIESPKPTAPSPSIPITQMEADPRTLIHEPYWR